MAQSTISHTRAALKSSSVKRAGKKIVRGVRSDAAALERKAQNEARMHLVNAKKGFARSTARVEHYIKENPKKAVAFAAVLAAVATGAASYALAHRKK